MARQSNPEVEPEPVEETAAAETDPDTPVDPTPEVEPEPAPPIVVDDADAAELEVLLGQAGLLHQVQHSVANGTKEKALAAYYRSVWYAHQAGARLPLMVDEAPEPALEPVPEPHPDDVTYRSLVGSGLVVMFGAGQVQFTDGRYTTHDAAEIAGLDICPDVERAA